MLAVSIKGQRRSDTDYMKWDFEASAITKNKISSVTWYFSPQSLKPVRTKTTKAPGYVWTKPGDKRVTVVIVDSKGVKGSATIDIKVGKPTKDPAPTPRPTSPPVKAPEQTPAPADPPATALPTLGALPPHLFALERGIYQLKNFNKGQNSTKLGASNFSFDTKSDIVGQGSTQTKLQLVAHTSTKKASVPTVEGNGGGLKNPTNQVSVGRVQGLSRVLKGFSVYGSEQGHLYNGLRLDHISNLTIEDVAVYYIPGNASGNPGETFIININRVTGKITIKKLQVVGGTGALQSAAGIGFNSVSATTVIEGLLTKAMHESAGIATWQQTGDLDIYGWVHDSPTRNFGAERLAANARFHDPSNQQKRTRRGTHDATYTWGDHEAGDFKGGSLTWRFSSEAALEKYLIPGRPKIKVLTNVKSAKQGIKKSARVILNGRDRTSDLLVWAGA